VLLCREPAPLVFVEQSFGRPVPTDTACLIRRGASSVRLFQRTRGTIRVWILPERAR
jgi:hypothetical protein